MMASMFIMPFPCDIIEHIKGQNPNYKASFSG